MPATPRVVFAAFRSIEEPMLLSWIRFRDLVHTADTVSARTPRRPRTAERHSVTTTASTSSHTGIWRVLASNNRELGRSSRTYSSFEQARAHVVQLQSRSHELVATPVVGPQAGLYGWLLECDGEPVITCGRWYAPSSSKETVISTVAALRDAVVTDAPQSVLDPHRRNSGRRRAGSVVAPW